MRWRVLCLGTIALALAGAGLARGGTRAHTPAQPAAAKPNIVFILTDDLSWNLINRRFAPHIVGLEQRGETFNHFFVADSLCCPSRATIFTGLFPHDTKVVTNTPPSGGFAKFQKQRLDRRTYALADHRAGYATAMLGKYLNGYGDPKMTRATAPVPPGWTDWHVSNLTGYTEFNYLLNDDGKFHHYGGPAGGCGAAAKPDNYGVDVLSADATNFIARQRKKPFVIEVATFAPHAPYTPAPRNACDFPGLKEPRDPSFNTENINAPAWLRKRTPLNRRQVKLMDTDYRLRAQSVEAVDRLLANVEAKLASEHRLRNTYIVFGSDNGYHMGQHRLLRGKMTAFDTDIRVPLIVAGPGVPAGRAVSQVVQNTDLAPTFMQLARAKPPGPVDGHSLVPLLHPPKRPLRWRTVALVEHRGNDYDTSDPDYEDGPLGGDPPSYSAVRISARRLPHFDGPVEAVYVAYRDAAHEHEFYNLLTDPFERRNVANRLTAAQTRELNGILKRLTHCHTERACWAAAVPQRVSLTRPRT